MLCKVDQRRLTSFLFEPNAKDILIKMIRDIYMDNKAMSADIDPVPLKLNSYEYVSTKDGDRYIAFKMNGNKIGKCDVEDLPLLQQHHWSYIGGDIKCSITKKSFKRLAMNASKDERVYYIGDGCDVRKRNLRVAKSSVVELNETKETPPFKGVVASRPLLVWYGKWMGGKPGGAIYEYNRKGKIIVKVEFQKPSLAKTFTPANYGTMKAAWKAARIFQRQESLRRGTVKNMYRSVRTSEGNVYIQVHMPNDTMFLCDPDDVELVEAKNWTNQNGYAKTAKMRSFHNCKVDYEIVDHINGDTLDDRTVNLREGAIDGTNSKNRRLASNNTSGVTGVCYCKTTNSYIARWPENNRTRTRAFSCNKYGTVEAKQLACEFRREKDRVLGLHLQQYVDTA